MNIGFGSCIILAILFVIIGVLFAIFKEKAAKFVSGFNSFSKYIAIPTYIIWLILFFREVHFDNHKAFEKYLLK